jgi:hypothetical protein
MVAIVGRGRTIQEEEGGPTSDVSRIMVTKGWICQHWEELPRELLYLSTSSVALQIPGRGLPRGGSLGTFANLLVTERAIKFCGSNVKG